MTKKPYAIWTAETIKTGRKPYIVFETDAETIIKKWTKRYKVEPEKILPCSFDSNSGEYIPTDPDLRFAICWPADQMTKPEVIEQWYKDAVLDGEIPLLPGNPSVFEMALLLHRESLITLGKEQPEQVHDQLVKLMK